MKTGELAVAIALLATVLAKDKTPDEIAFVAALFSQLSSTLATIAAGQQLCQDDTAAPTDTGTPSTGGVAGLVGTGA